MGPRDAHADGVRAECRRGLTKRLNTARAAYDAIEAFLLEHVFCRPGLDDQHITETVVALWCQCGARIAVQLPARGKRP